MQNEGSFSQAKSDLYIFKTNFDYRDIVAFKQVEKNFIADEIKHNIPVSIFDSIDPCGESV